jgi:hypothetical protein
LGKPDFGYPYATGDGREDLDAGRDTLRVLRGAAFDGGESFLRCAFRDRTTLRAGAGTSGVVPLDPSPALWYSDPC